MHRGARLVLLAGLTWLLAATAPTAAEAAPAPPPRADAPVAQPEGRRIARSDWQEHVPLAIGLALVVIAVDAVFVMKLLHDRRAEQERRAAALRPPLGVNGSGPPGHGPGRF